jgi:hypothetical protein
MKKLFFITVVIASFLPWIDISDALTVNEALTFVDRQITEKGLSPKYMHVAVSALDRLTEKGVTVDNAFQFVDAAINHRFHPKQIALIVHFIERVHPKVINTATETATSTILIGYSPGEVMDRMRELDTPSTAQRGE